MLAEWKVPSFTKYCTNINITIFGAPCAGKTQAAESLVERLTDPERRVKTMAVKDIGQVMREVHQADPSRFAQINTGGLVDSAEILALVDELVSEARANRQGIIFTGQPRRVPEAKYFEQHQYIDLVFCLSAPDDVLISRALGRGRADDDSADKARERIKVFGQNTQPVLDYFRHEGIPTFYVDADRPPAEVVDEIYTDLQIQYSRVKRLLTA